MAFSLIDPTPGAVPIEALAKERLAAWFDTASKRERPGVGERCHGW